MSSQRVQSKRVEADGVAAAYPCDFYGVAVDAAGAVILYDNASAASGNVIWSGTGPVSFSLGGGMHVHCLNGIYVDLTGNKVNVYCT